MYMIDLVWRVSGDRKLSVCNSCSWLTVMMTVYLSQMLMQMGCCKLADCDIVHLPRTFFAHILLRAVATCQNVHDCLS